MGNFCSISIPCDKLLSGCLDFTFRKAVYISKIKENVNDLKIAAEELTDLHNDVTRRVKVEEEQQLKRRDDVQRWISRAEAAKDKANELLGKGSQEIERLCLGGYCSKNYKSSYRFAKEVDKMLRDVADLKANGDFKEVAGKVPAAPGVPRPSEPTVGLDSTFNQVWTCLREEKQVGIVGLYGMGGVGKTTLLTRINNESLKTLDYFDIVIWVVVSKDLKLNTVQESIGRIIGCSDDLWKNKSLDEKAVDIFNALRRKRFVMLLDDIWERVDLKKLGVPLPDTNNGSKVVFTTRSEAICGLMDADKTVKVNCLEGGDAWDLFRKKVGEQTLCGHPDIHKLARDVASECGGLPLALITIGRAMACKKTPQEWRHAIEVLRKSASEFSGMGDEVFPLLKFSYDNLSKQKIRTCFLYCSLFPEDFLINKNDLIDYWIGEGISDESDDREVVVNWGYDVIGCLLHACLLEDKDDCVRMHDVIRDMALWIASDIERDQQKFFVQTGAQLSKAPEVGKWEGARRVSLMANDIVNLSETPNCSNLRTLFLGSIHLNKISRGFFQFMPNLTVLDLSNNISLLGLPRGVWKLVSLQYLNLSRTGIKELPKELSELVKLRYLNLEYTHSLYLLPHGVISCFPMMRVLRMFRSEDCILSRDESLVEELQCLEKLNMLTVTIRSAAALERLSSFQGMQSSTRVLYLELFHDSKLVNFSSLANMKNLDTLHICHCGSLEELQIDCNLAQVATTERPFRSLSSVYVENCLKLSNLTWLILAQNLTFLSLSNCPKLVEVASVEKLPEVPELVENLNPFAKLKAVELVSLPNLKSFYWNGLPLPSVKDVRVVDCPFLDKRPLDTSRAGQ
ncbi:disease resistance protein [Populus alba x Populus x berolinensis]|uniref:Disease resistance protein n=1 Tax=Populus alba x Populus x berolinensis TaxID=444605 RepID=A0AAD6WIZ4_9ROSI|nr:disease resistance protein [Populus alba x Populus x berolinensis]